MNWYKKAINNDDIFELIDDGEGLKAKELILKDNSLELKKIDFPSAESVYVLTAPYGKYIIDIDFEYYKEAIDWIWDINDFELSDYVEYSGDNFEKDFWDGVFSGSYVYHGTSSDRIDLIKKEGLEPRQETNSLTNSSNGPAVYTSPDYDTAAYIYDVVIRIDLGKMKSDGYMPPVSLEVGVDESEMRNALAYKLGIDDFINESLEQGLSEETVLIYGKIPPKYLSFGEENELV